MIKMDGTFRILYCMSRLTLYIRCRFKSSETLFNMLTYHYSNARFNILNFRRNNNKKFRSFKSKEKVHKKEVGPTMVSAIKASSVTL